VTGRSWVTLQRVVQDGGRVVSTLTLSQAAMHRLRQARQTLGASHEGKSKCCCHPSQAIQSVHHKSAASPQPCGTTRWSVMVLFFTNSGGGCVTEPRRRHSVERPCHLEQLSKILTPSACSLSFSFFFPSLFHTIWKSSFCITPVHLLFSVLSLQFLRLLQESDLDILGY